MYPTGTVQVGVGNDHGTKHFVQVHLADPRPDARYDIKIAGSGEVLRWGGQSGQGVVFPAWLAQTATVNFLGNSNNSTKVVAICFWAYVRQRK